MSTGTKKANPPRKTKPKGRHPDKALSAAFVRTAPPGRHAEGNGLYLFVQPSGTRSWIQRLVIRGRRRELGLGTVALVSLSEAREKALANRKLAREGGGPACREASCAGRAELRRSHCAPGGTEASCRWALMGWLLLERGHDPAVDGSHHAFRAVGEGPPAWRPGKPHDGSTDGSRRIACPGKIGLELRDR